MLMLTAPGGMEWIVIVLISLIVFAVPLILLIVLLISHVRLHASLRDLHRKLDEFRSKSP